jgi:hypothetical protein
VCARFAEEGIPTNVTLCFNASQALLAARAGAFIISPFIGRVDDTGVEGMQLIREIVDIYDAYEFYPGARRPVRHLQHVVESTLAGATPRCRSRSPSSSSTTRSPTSPAALPRRPPRRHACIQRGSYSPRTGA